jgi:hypothetical protein
VWTPPADGLYCVRVGMLAPTGGGPSTGAQTILVEVDSNPSVPRLLNVRHGQRVNGVVKLDVQVPGAGPLASDVLLSDVQMGEPFDQEGLGSEQQTKIGKNNTTNRREPVLRPDGVESARPRPARPAPRHTAPRRRSRGRWPDA